MKKIYKNGIKFECQGSSNCCISRNKNGYVYLSNKDVLRLSKFTKLNREDFLKIYCDKTDNFTHLKENNKDGKCQFLNNKKCSVYKARPTQCRTWPFWPENMNTKIWDEEIANFCPGVGKGKKFTQKEIEKKIFEDKENEKQMFLEIC